MDVYKVLQDLENKAAGVDPKTGKMPEGYFISFRPVGLPIDPADYSNPWTPTGSELNQATSSALSQIAANSSGSTTPSLPNNPPPTIDPNQLIAAKVAQSEINYFNAFQLTDDKLQMDQKWSVMPSAGHVSDAWFAIITGAQEVASNMVLNSDLQKSIDQQKAILVDANGNPTPHYTAYLNYQSLYQQAVQDLDGQYANAMTDPNQLAMWPIQGKIPQEKVNQAMENWTGLGFKTEIETALNILNAQGMDPASALINRAKLAYENSLVEIGTLGTFPYTSISPSTFYDQYAQDGWTHYTQAASTTKVNSSSSSSSEQGSAGFSLGFFSIGATASHEQSQTDLGIDTSNMSISFEYCTADVRRPWLDTNLLNLGNWFLVDNPKNCISDGTFGQQLSNAADKTTFLPSIVTSLVFVRNLKITWAASQTQIHTFQQSTSGGGVVGIGPFFCGGGGSSSNSNYAFQNTFNSQGIHVQGVQLIGYCSTILPASPQLDSKNYMTQKSNSNGSAKTSTTSTAPVATN